MNSVREVKDLSGLLESGLVLDSLGGENQKIVASKDDGQIILNGHVKVDQGDIVASNGIIHLTSKLL